MKRWIVGFAVLGILVVLLGAQRLDGAIPWAENGHFYDYVEAQVTWSEARDMAASMTYNALQGYLATITSEGENAFIIDNFSEYGFLGGSDAEVEGDWRWVVGPEAGQLFFRGKYPDPSRQTFIYSAWGSNEPNDYDNTVHGFPYAGEDFLMIDPDFPEWNDIPGAPYTFPERPLHPGGGLYVEFGGVVIPEPSTLILVSMGALALTVGWWRRRR